MKKILFVVLIAFSSSSMADYKITFSTSNVKLPEIVGYTQTEKEKSWEDFAKPRDLLFSTDWQFLSWQGKSLDGLPVLPYPNPMPSGEINVNSNNLSSSDIESLNSIQKVGSHYNLYENQLVNVDALINLVEVVGSINIRTNNLINVNGLRNLQSVGRYLMLHENSFIEDLSGLSGVQSVGFDVWIDTGLSLEKKIPSDAWLCQPSQSDKFRSGYAQQSEVCE